MDMESAKEIQKKFDKLFAEAYKSPLPKLKYRRSGTQEPAAKSNKSCKSSKHLPNGLRSPPVVERVERIPETMLPPSNINCSFTEVIKSNPAFLPSLSQQQHTISYVVEDQISDVVEDQISNVEDQISDVVEDQISDVVEDQISDVVEDPISDVVEGSGQARVSDFCGEDAEDIDDNNEVSSVIGEDEEFFLHKPRPTRNALCSNTRRLNLDGLWSNLIIRKTPAVKNYGIQEGHQCFLRRNLRRCIIFFKGYILHMELLQRDQQLKRACDAKVRHGAVELSEGARVATEKRGTKRKSLSEVNAVKPNKLNKPAGLSRKNAKPVKTTNALKGKRVMGRLRNIENKSKTPDVVKVEKRKGRLSKVKNNTKTADAIKVTKRKERSSQVENKTQPSDAIKVKNPSGNPRKHLNLQPSEKKSIKELSSKTTKRAPRGKNVAVLAKPEEAVSSALRKTKAPCKTRRERRSSISELINAGEICNGDKSKVARGEKVARTCARPNLVSIKKAGRSDKIPKTIVASHKQTSQQRKQKVSVRKSGNNDAPKVQPLSPCATAAESTEHTHSKATGVAIDLPSVAMDDPLVAASLREDWGIGMRPLFSRTSGRTHCGGIWKAIIDEQEHC